MHGRDQAAAPWVREIVEYALARLSIEPLPLDAPRREVDLAAACGPTISDDGMGASAALALFGDQLAPACLSVDHPLHLSFIPSAPTPASALFDLVVSAANIYAGSHLEGAGAIHAENEVLAFLADLAGLPEGAGGVFVSGGTAGNLSALVAARHRWRSQAGQAWDRTRGVVVCSSGTHSSVRAAARVMDLDVVEVPADARGRMTGAALQATMDAMATPTAARVAAIVATAGTTNAGVVDDLAGAAEVAERCSVWLHVDGAYGAAALLCASRRELFVGIERADSFIVDPHKWLFAPYDSCALVYRDPAWARAAHTQHGEYLECYQSRHEWDPSDYAHHLSRRARGLPLWFSLATYGTKAYAAAVQASLDLADEVADMVRRARHLELVIDPELSIVLVRRLGWSAPDYQRWSDELLADGVGFIMPTTWQGEPVIRFCFVNPLTTAAQMAGVLSSLEDR